MPDQKSKLSEIVDLNKRRLKKRLPKVGPSVSARPPLTDLPAVVVKTNAGRTAMIVNIPMLTVGAEMVLSLIELHPGASLYTCDDDYVSLRDIVTVFDPTRGEIEVEAGRQEALADPVPFRLLQVMIGTRWAAQVGLVNIPDTPDGLALFRTIVEEYRHDGDGKPSGYTFYTDDNGYIPVHEIAAANPPPKRSSDDKNPSR
jgi:hypothetical protein